MLKNQYVSPEILLLVVIFLLLCFYFFYFYRFVFRMASSSVPVENTKNGFTIVTQVVPGGREQYGLGTGGGVSTQGPLKKFLKGEPKALGVRMF